MKVHRSVKSAYNCVNFNQFRYIYIYIYFKKILNTTTVINTKLQSSLRHTNTKRQRHRDQMTPQPCFFDGLPASELPGRF